MARIMLMLWTLLLVFGSLTYAEMEGTDSVSIFSSDVLPSSFDPSMMTSPMDSSSTSYMTMSSDVKTDTTMVLTPTSTMSTLLSTAHSDQTSIIDPTSTPVEASTEYVPTPTVTPTSSDLSSHVVPTTAIMPSSSSSHVVPTTTVPPTTHATPTTKPNDVVDYKLLSGKDVCIEMKGEVKIHMQYKLENSSEYKIVNFVLPKNGKVSGECAVSGKDSTSTVVVSFTFVTFSWTFDVKKDNSWTSQSMTVNVTLKGNKLFPNAAEDMISATSEKSSNVDMIKAKADMSYQCSPMKSYMLSNNVTVNFENVNVQPFNETNGHFAKAENCEKPKPSKKTNNIVPIAVGCALAGLIVIVLIAYLIGRRKTSRGYQQV